LRDLRWRQILCRHRAGCGCTQIGQASFVLKNRQQLAGAAAEDQDHAIARRQSALRIPVETGGDLHGEGVAAANVAILDVAIAGRLENVQMTDGRNHHFAARVGREAVLHGLNQFRRMDRRQQLGARIDAGHYGFTRCGAAGAVQLLLFSAA
jgi:hypothetical protein